MARAQIPAAVIWQSADDLPRNGELFELDVSESRDVSDHTVSEASLSGMILYSRGFGGLGMEHLSAALPKSRLLILDVCFAAVAQFWLRSAMALWPSVFSQF